MADFAILFHFLLHQKELRAIDRELSPYSYNHADSFVLSRLPFCFGRFSVEQHADFCHFQKEPTALRSSFHFILPFAAGRYGFINKIMDNSDMRSEPTFARFT
ncbi:hypothetical protein FE784_07235 [Paenibacillus hemerocallicola]|uniref:Uncharacterized protein n=1 Tax=Paenibacillus hemerocallicola TaxID=1172614 RepID=A0A5C4TEN0_9BACL|nr:hypothetical protein [Paenibacillus hemerocallicola]TNJ66987.1 hypothetical protein FE784_07235 [Paenibacillus hemerocallicola]